MRSVGAGVLGPGLGLGVDPEVGPGVGTGVGPEGAASLKALDLRLREFPAFEP